MRLALAACLLSVASPAAAQLSVPASALKAKRLWVTDYRLPMPAPAEPGSADPEADVRATVVRLFDGMRARDTAAVRSVFHPEARLHSVAREGEAYTLEESPISAFVAALGRSPVGWDERVGDLEVRVDDGLATVWTAYRLFVNDRFIHCGVDAFTLVQGAAGWRVLQITDTRRATCD